MGTVVERSKRRSASFCRGSSSSRLFQRSHLDVILLEQLVGDCRRSLTKQHHKKEGQNTPSKHACVGHGLASWLTCAIKSLPVDVFGKAITSRMGSDRP